MHMHDREAFVVHRVGYDCAQVSDLGGHMGRDVGHAQREVERKRVEGVFGLAERRGTGNFVKFGGGRTLSLGQAVHAVVHNDSGDVQVARRLRGYVFVANAEKVAVARDYDDIEVGASHLDAKRDGQRPAVNAVNAVGLISLKQMNHIAGAADAGYHNIVFHGQFGVHAALFDGGFQSAPHAEIAAAGAPFEIIFRVLDAHTGTLTFCSCSRRSLIRPTRSLTLKGKPVYCVIASALTPCERSTLANCPR